MPTLSLLKTQVGVSHIETTSHSGYRIGGSLFRLLRRVRPKGGGMSKWIRLCNFGDCPEFRVVGDVVYVRNSVKPIEVIAFSFSEFERLRDDMKAGKYDHIEPESFGKSHFMET